MLTQENAIKHHYVRCLQRELNVHDVDAVCGKYIDPFDNPLLAW